MEADDVIGTLATGAGMPVDVVTGDRDLFQLVDDGAEVRILYTARGVGKHERVDNAWVRAKYDVDAAQYPDFATLRGDRSEEHTSELQSLMRISYAVFCLKKKHTQK